MKKILVICAICALAALYVHIINRIGHPHFSHPALTKAQKAMIHQAELRHGKYPIERRGYGDGYFVMIFPNKERRL